MFIQANILCITVYIPTVTSCRRVSSVSDSDLLVRPSCIFSLHGKGTLSASPLGGSSQQIDVQV